MGINIINIEYLHERVILEKEKTLKNQKGQSNNGQSRDSDNILNRTEIDRTNTKIKIKDEQHGPNQKIRGESMCSVLFKANSNKSIVAERGRITILVKRKSSNYHPVHVNNRRGCVTMTSAS